MLKSYSHTHARVHTDQDDFSPGQLIPTPPQIYNYFKLAPLRRRRPPNLEDLSERPLTRVRVASRVAPRGAKRRPKKILTSETSKTQEIARLRAHTHTYSQGQRGLS